MAMIRCLECGNQMSDSANKCPHCGANKWQSAGYTVAQKIGLAVLFLMGGAVMTYGMANEDQVVIIIGIGISACSLGFIFGRTRTRGD